MHKALLAQPESEEEVIEYLPPIAPSQNKEMIKAPPLSVKEYILS